MNAPTGLRHCRGYIGRNYQQPPHDVPYDLAHFYTHETECKACYLAYAADWRAKRAASEVTSVPRASSASAGQTLDGIEPLTEVLARAGYTTVEAVARYATFLHPETVEQTHGQALFPVVRDMAMANRGSHVLADDGRMVMRDDNRSPTDASLWSGRLRKDRDIQFNYVWNDSQNRDSYTALWNIVATPAFLAKTTDGSNHPEVPAALRRRAYDLYGMIPAGAPLPSKPLGYDDLVSSCLTS